MKKLVSIITFLALVAVFASIPDQTDRTIALITLGVLTAFIALVFSWAWIRKKIGSILFYSLYPLFFALATIQWLQYKWKYRNRNVNKPDSESLKLTEYKTPLGIGA